MLFCDTPKQSVVVAIIAGVISGAAGVHTGNIWIVLIVAGLLGIGLEIAAHEYRQDEQYVEFKKSVFR